MVTGQRAVFAPACVPCNGCRCVYCQPHLWLEAGIQRGGRVPSDTSGLLAPAKVQLNTWQSMGQVASPTSDMRLAAIFLMLPMRGCSEPSPCYLTCRTCSHMGSAAASLPCAKRAKATCEWRGIHGHRISQGDHSPALICFSGGS